MNAAAEEDRLRILKNPPPSKICHRLKITQALTAPRLSNKKLFALDETDSDIPFDNSDDIVAGSSVELLGMRIVKGSKKIYNWFSPLWLANVLQSSHQENGGLPILPPVERSSKSPLLFTTSNLFAPFAARSRAPN